jgi:hypothetical protein
MGGVLSNAKEIVELVHKAGNLDLYRRLVELQEEIVELAQQKTEVEGKFAAAKRELDLRKSLEFKTPFYFLSTDSIPFCPRCWENNSKPIHLLILPGGQDFQKATSTFCSVCGGEWFKVTNGGWGFKPHKSAHNS